MFSMMWKEKLKKHKSLVESFLSLSVLNGLVILIPLVAMPYVLRVVGPAHYGLYGFIYILVQYVLVFNNYGFDYSVTKEVAQHRQDTAYLNRVYNAVLGCRKDKFKWVKQHDSMQCGVACLAMICRHYGKEYSLEYLDSYCHANTAGVSMFGIAEAAGMVGFDTMAAAVSTDELNEIKLPCIGEYIKDVAAYNIAYREARRTLRRSDDAYGKFGRRGAEGHHSQSHYEIGDAETTRHGG